MEDESFYFQFVSLEVKKDKLDLSTMGPSAKKMVELVGEDAYKAGLSDEKFHVQAKEIFKLNGPAVDVDILLTELAKLYESLHELTKLGYLTDEEELKFYENLLEKFNVKGKPTLLSNLIYRINEEPKTGKVPGEPLDRLIFFWKRAFDTRKQHKKQKFWPYLADYLLERSTTGEGLDEAGLFRRYKRFAARVKEAPKYANTQDFIAAWVLLLSVRLPKSELLSVFKKCLSPEILREYASQNSKK